MNLEKYLVVAGIPGVHKVIATRTNGFIIEDRNEKRSRFVPMRQSQVTPLATVGVYTYSDSDGENTIPLSDVFQKMLDQSETIPPVKHESPSQVLRDYFTAVLPDHDRDRVHINDIKKCLKWFTFMHEKGLFDEIKAADAADTAENSESVAEPIPAVVEEVKVPAEPEKPAPKAKVKAKKA